MTDELRDDRQRETNADEDARLLSALTDSDHLLTESLREDERRRRVRRLVRFTLFVGGIAMGTAVVAVLAGWLTLFTPPPNSTADKDAWVERLTSLRDHMHTAFAVGPDLTLEDPETGLEIVQAAWPKITEPEVKTGLLKTFAFSKALSEKHPKVLQVLHLGMTDDDPEIRKYAATYVEEYSGKNFANDKVAYETWYHANADRSPMELLAQYEKGGTRPAGRLENRDREDPIARADELASEGWGLWKQQKWDDAAQLFEEAVKLDPQNPHAWNGLGWARLNGGDMETSIEAFEKCLEIESDHAGALNGVGQAYLSMGEYENARKFLTKAASKNASAAWFGLARLYLLTGKYEAAKKWIEKALSQQPGDTTLLKMRAAAKEGKLPEDLAKQIGPVGKPTDAQKAASEGWQQFNQGKLRIAERNFRRALAKDPENLAAINGLGFVLLNSGKAASAKEYFEKYLKLEPNAPGPMNGLARALKDEGKVDEAIALWEKMLKLYPGPNAGAVGLAQTFIERGEHAKAIPLLEGLVKAQPDNAEFKQMLEAAREGAKKSPATKG